MKATANSPIPARAERVRIAAPSDAEALTRLINAAFVVESMAFDGDRVDLEGVHALMGKGTFLVTEEADDKPLPGCVYLEPRGERCYLGLLSVAPSLQGKGLGRRLVAAAEVHALSLGCRVMDLRVISPRAQLVPFYRHLHYLEAGTAPFPTEVPVKVPCHYILMTKALV